VSGRLASPSLTALFICRSQVSDKRALPWGESVKTTHGVPLRSVARNSSPSSQRKSLHLRRVRIVKPWGVKSRYTRLGMSIRTDTTAPAPNSTKRNPKTMRLSSGGVRAGVDAYRNAMPTARPTNVAPISIHFTRLGLSLRFCSIRSLNRDLRNGAWRKGESILGFKRTPIQRRVPSSP